MKWTYPAMALAVVAAAGLAAPAAYSSVRSHWQETQMMQPANWGGHMHDGYDGDHHMSAAHVEGKLAYLKAELEITDAQQPQWDAFANVVREVAADLRNLRGGPETGEDEANRAPMHAPDRLDRMEQFAATGLQAIQRVKEPLTSLYAALNEDQKDRADRLFEHRHWR